MMKRRSIRFEVSISRRRQHSRVHLCSILESVAELFSGPWRASSTDAGRCIMSRSMPDSPSTHAVIYSQLDEMRRLVIEQQQLPMAVTSSTFDINVETANGSLLKQFNAAKTLYHISQNVEFVK